MSTMDRSSQHSSQLSKSSQDPIQIHYTGVIMKPVLQVFLSSVLPEAIFNICQAAVCFIILHYIDTYIEEYGTTMITTTMIWINLLNMLVSDSFIEAGTQYMNKSLELKQNNASKVYFAYTYIFGLGFTVLISLSLLFGLKKQLAKFIIWREFDSVENSLYFALVIVYSLLYFTNSTRRFLKVECLFVQNMVLSFSLIIEQLYIITMQIFFTSFMAQKVTLKSYIPTFIGPIIITALVQLGSNFHLFQKKVRYSTTHFVQKSLFKPFRGKILGEILKNTCYYIILNSGDALIYVFTYQVVAQLSEYSVVAFAILFIELTNSFNKSVIMNMDSAFRINMQLKRYDRVYQFFQLSFVFFFINLGFQIITFALRNTFYRQVFHGEFDSSFDFFHCSLDGLLGTFNAFTMAVVRSESNKKMGSIIGVFKLLLSIAFWLVGHFTNSGNSHFSTMIYFYKYCVDLIGFGFYILIFVKYHKLRKFNYQEEQQIHAEQGQGQGPPKLVLQEIQPIDPVSRNTSTDRDSKSKDQSKDMSKEATTSKDITKSSKLDLIQSQSWTLEEGKEGKALFGKED
ncbi:MatE_and transmembrane domain-containing protein [Hexamita inflata]|uniref:MatE and transmembrane domain-containing protein n=1 Tax=Hexamita inflata TaxID=28002 RepID=A0AA86R9B2_9EUKA|nr:MatE and transmembrane domain-containing protein [Hexamita inflata]